MALLRKRLGGVRAGRGLASDDDATFWASLARRIEQGDWEAEAEVVRTRIG